MIAGCAVHRVGMVVPSGAGVALVSPDGREERLLLLGEAAAMRQLGDHLVEVDGRKTFGRLQVSRFRALEGPHGMPVWLGPVERLGMQVGIADEGSGELLVVDEQTGRQIEAWLGDRVAVEGYVDGPEHLQVLYWVLLDPPRDSGPAPQ